MRSKIQSWGGATSLTELGIQETQIEEIIDCAAAQGQFGTIKELDESDINEILRSSL